MKKLKGAAKRILGGLQNRLSKQARFGQSKHEAKQAAREAYLKEHGTLEGYNPAKVDGIFSIGTMETYRAAMQPFAEWCSAHNVKNARQITEAHAAAYLREREGSFPKLKILYPNPRLRYFQNTLLCGYSESSASSWLPLDKESV